ncbi:hypothetical protein D3C86_1945930 [compost metagenome]
MRRLFGDFAELDPGVEDALDAVLGTVQRVGVGVYQQGGITGTGETMRDAGAHEPGTNDYDFLFFIHIHIRSRLDAGLFAHNVA